MRRVTFAVDYPPSLAHPMHRRLDDTPGVSRADLLMWGPMDTVTTLAWYDGPPVAVRSLLDAVESTTAVDLVAGDGGTYAFVHQTEYELGAPVLDLVAESRVVFLPPVTFEQGGRARVDAVGEREFLAEFHANLQEHVDATVERVADFRRWSTPAVDVTTRQREALATAVAVGYYDVPRTGSVADVAAELGCAASTAGELLRKGEAALVRGFVGERRRQG
ncbi:helix-turn-helix domain-containing protein [Haloarchaeobius baliensis]|uniref:helix-turn-helix domain-containing protein n=1 Tax=Haloarchaeobius baliensis TaxID=1670458 RepID=UPI003F8819F4